MNIESEFLQSLQSKHTRISYENDLKQFFSFLKTKEVSAVSQITRKSILDFQDYLKEFGGRFGEPAAPYSVARKMSAIKAYFGFLVEHRNLANNPFDQIKSPSRQVKNERKILTMDEIEGLIQAASKSTVAPLHQALIAINFYAVMRVSEFLNAKIEDFYSEDNLYFLKVRTKGGKFQSKEIPERAAMYLIDYLSWMEEKKRDMHTKNFLFRPSRNNHQGQDQVDKPINPRTVNKLLKKYAKEARIFKNISSHSGRASAITNYLKLSEEHHQVADIYGAKILAGHSKIATTEIYDKRRREGLNKGKLSDLMKKAS